MSSNDNIEIYHTTPDHLTMRDRRDGVTVCPHCMEKFDVEDWDNNIIAYSLDREKFRKNLEYIIEINTCPDCDKISWNHCDLGSTTRRFDISDKIKEKLKEELAKREKEAARKVQKSLCVKCNHLYKLAIRYGISPTRKCKKGGGTLKQECDMFTELEKGE